MDRQQVCKWYPICPMKDFYEKGMLAEKWIKEYCLNAAKGCKRYEMIEKGLSCPYWILPNGKEGKRLK